MIHRIVNNGNGTGRRNHLKAKHKVIFEELAATEQDKAPEVSIKQLLLGKNPFDKESERYKKLDEYLLNFIINSCQPLSIVDEENFVKMLAKFDDRYILKRRQTLTKTDLPKKMESTKIKTK